MSDKIAEYFTTYGIGPTQPVSELQSLRDENARLSGSLSQAIMTLRYYAKTAISARAVDTLEKIEKAALAGQEEGK